MEPLERWQLTPPRQHSRVSPAFLFFESSSPHACACLIFQSDFGGNNSLHFHLGGFVWIPAKNHRRNFIIKAITCLSSLLISRPDSHLPVAVTTMDGGEEGGRGGAFFLRVLDGITF